MATLEWTTGLEGERRSYPSCIISGDQVIVWGGKYPAEQPNTPEPIVKDPLLIYSISKNEWVKTYTPPSGMSSGGDTSGSGKPVDPTGTGGGDSKSNNTAGIVGGILGFLAVVGVVVGIWWWRKRKQQREGGGGGGENKSSIVKPSSAHTPGSVPDENKTLDSGKHTNDTSITTAAAGGYDSPSRSPNNPQTAMLLNPELEWSLRDIENQQKQLDLKRKLLVLQQEEQQLRGPLSPLTSTSTAITGVQQLSPLWYQQPAPNPQSTVVGTPVTTTVSVFKAGGGDEMFGNKSQSGYEPHASRFTPPPVKQTVHTLPDSYVAPHPQPQQRIAVAVSGDEVRSESQMYQDAIEPTFGSGSVTMPSWYPGLEYQDGAIHNGVGWVRPANGPHTVLEREVSVAGVAGGVQQKDDATGYHN
jgi:hypothetical protein